MAYQALRVEETDGVATITLNRPDSKNAINTFMLEELQDALDQAVDDDTTHGVVLTGAGDGFSAGADLAEMQMWSADEATARAETAETITALLERSSLVTAAAIHGYCLGGGHELALACDLRTAAPDATLGQPEIQVGLTPGFGATVRLPRIAGLNAARRLILHGERVSGEEAKSIGIVDQVIEENQLLQATRQAVKEISDHSAPGAYRATKQLLADTFDQTLEGALASETHAFAHRFETQDAEEGIAAFLEHRDPEFTGD